MSETEFSKPKVSKKSQEALDRAEAQFNEFNDSIKEMSNTVPSASMAQEEEPQTKLSQNQIRNAKDIYLKPEKTITDRNPFNEKFRDDYNYYKEYVQFIAEHKEIQGDDIETWTKKFRGVPAEFWRVPTNKPVWGPRYLAEQIASRNYRRLMMDESKATGTNAVGVTYGQLQVESIKKRMDAIPVSSRKSVFV